MLSTARHRGEHGSGRAARDERPRCPAHAILGAILLAGLLLAVPLSAQQSDPAPTAVAPDAGTTGVQASDSKPTDDPAATWQLWESPAELDTWPEKQSSSMWVAGRVLLAVLLVIALVMLLLLLLRRYGIAGGASGIGAPRLQMLANLSLGQRRTIYLIRVDGVEILVASAGDGLRLLTELPGTRDALLAGAPPGAGKRSTAAGEASTGQPAGRGSFLSTFRRALGGPIGDDDDRGGAGNPGASEPTSRRGDTLDDGTAPWGTRSLHPNR